MSNYTPHPAETGDIELGSELDSLIEAMAENVHEMWAQTRVEQGWTYGAKRDDDKKHHPCLVPYSELPDSEKVYDRNSAVETLKLIKKFGFEIRKVELKKLCKGQIMSLRKIRNLEKLYQDMSEADRYWLAKAALGIGENFTAFDLAEKLKLPQHKLHIQGLALARSGSLKRAFEFAEKLKDFNDSECAGLRSRIYKDLAVVTNDSAEKKKHFIHAAEISLRVFESDENYYNGVNAASCFFLGGETEKAKKIAKKTALLAEKDDDLWAVSTLGECALLLGNREEAKRQYRKASRLLRGRYGDFATTLRQLKLILTQMDGSESTLEEYVDLPCIALITDSTVEPDTDIPQKQFEEWLNSHPSAMAYMTCSNTRSVLAAEVFLANGIECHIALSLPERETLERFFPDSQLRARAEKVLSHELTTVIPPECQETGENDEIISDFTAHYVTGLAKLKSQLLSFPLSSIILHN